MNSVEIESKPNSEYLATAKLFFLAPINAHKNVKKLLEKAK